MSGRGRPVKKSAGKKPDKSKSNTNAKRPPRKPAQSLVQSSSAVISTRARSRSAGNRLNPNEAYTSSDSLPLQKKSNMKKVDQEKGPCGCGPDFYTNVLGPTADETILVGLETFMKFCQDCPEKKEENLLVDSGTGLSTKESTASNLAEPQLPQSSELSTVTDETPEKEVTALETDSTPSDPSRRTFSVRESKTMSISTRSPTRETFARTSSPAQDLTTRSISPTSDSTGRSVSQGVVLEKESSGRTVSRKGTSSIRSPIKGSSVRTVPRPESSIRTVPRPESSIRTVTRPESSIRTVPEAESSIRTVPEAESSIRTVPRPESSIRTVPRPESSIRTVPEAESSIRTVPEAESSIRTVPRPESSIRTVPRPESSIRTVPRPESSIRTVPRPESSIRTVPDVESSIRTVPRPESSIRTVPEAQSSIRTVPRPESSIRTAPRPESSIRTVPTPESSIRTVPRSDSSVREPSLISAGSISRRTMPIREPSSTPQQSIQEEEEYELSDDQEDEEVEEEESELVEEEETYEEYDNPPEYVETSSKTVTSRSSRISRLSTELQTGSSSSSRQSQTEPPEVKNDVSQTGSTMEVSSSQTSEHSISNAESQTQQPSSKKIGSEPSPLKVNEAQVYQVKPEVKIEKSLEKTPPDSTTTASSKPKESSDTCTCCPCAHGGDNTTTSSENVVKMDICACTVCKGKPGMRPAVRRSCLKASKCKCSSTTSANSKGSLSTLPQKRQVRLCECNPTSTSVTPSTTDSVRVSKSLPCGDTNEACFKVRYAITKITKFYSYTTFEVMRSTRKKPRVMPKSLEGVFVLKNSSLLKKDSTVVS